jgi:hypothetical protein
MKLNSIILSRLFRFVEEFLRIHCKILRNSSLDFARIPSEFTTNSPATIKLSIFSNTINMYWILNLYNRVWKSPPKCKSLGLFINGEVNVWKVPFKQSFFEFLKISHAKLSCDDFFIFCYWFCLTFAFVGFCESVLEFVRVYGNQKARPATFWNRQYKCIPPSYQRAARIFGTVLNVAASFGQIYGYTNFRYTNLLPWIIANSVVVSLEIVYWIINGLASKSFKMKPMKSILMLIVRLAMVTHVMMVIKELAI